MTLYSATIMLILVLDPLGNVPIFLSILNNVESKRRTRVILRETFFAFLILLFFLFCGKYIMSGLQITEPALNIAGGIILFLIAIKMIFPPHEDNNEKLNGEPFIVPLAIPLIAGPSSLAMVLLFSTQYPEKMMIWSLALVLAFIVTSLTLAFGNQLRRVLGEKGLTALERLMGMILTVMAVQMFLNGLHRYFMQMH